METMEENKYLHYMHYQDRWFYWIDKLNKKSIIKNMKMQTLFG